MKKYLFLLIIILTSIIANTAQNMNELFRIEAIPMKSIYILGEPIMIYGKITYLGKEPIKLPIYRSITMGIKESCDGPNPELTIPDMPPDWWSQSEVIKPGWSVEKEEYINWCILRPRIVKVGYVMSFHPPEGKILPKDMWQGDVISEWKQIEIVKPEGIDAEAIYSLLGSNPTWQKFHEWPSKYRKDIFKKYPSSTYAAWMMLNSLDNPQGAKPEKIMELMKKNQFPIVRSVYDPAFIEGWKQLSGNELAEWQIKWSEYILDHHPDFAFAKRLKLVIAIDSIVIGQKEKGLLLLNEIAKEKNTKEGNWAAEFITLYRSK